MEVLLLTPMTTNSENIISPAPLEILAGIHWELWIPLIGPTFWCTVYLCCGRGSCYGSTTCFWRILSSSHSNDIRGQLHDVLTTKVSSLATKLLCSWWRPLWLKRLTINPFCHCYQNWSEYLRNTLCISWLNNDFKKNLSSHVVILMSLWPVSWCAFEHVSTQSGFEHCMDCLTLPCIFLYSMFSNIQMWLLFWDYIPILPLLHSQSMMSRGIFCPLSCALYHTILFSLLIPLHFSLSLFSLLTSLFFLLPFYTYPYMHLNCFAIQLSYLPSISTPVPPAHRWWLWSAQWWDCHLHSR